MVRKLWRLKSFDPKSVWKCQWFWAVTNSYAYNLYKSLMGQYSFWSICRWLYRDGLLPPKTFFIGYARSKLSMEDIKKNVVPHMKVCVCAYVCVGALWGGCTLCVCACTFYVCVGGGGGRQHPVGQGEKVWKMCMHLECSGWVHVWICGHISGVCVWWQLQVGQGERCAYISHPSLECSVSCSGSPIASLRILIPRWME